MSIVIVGGNDCMVWQYKTLCKEYKCRAKVFTQMKGTLRNKIGSPDLLVLFTGTVSHKMIRCGYDVYIGKIDELEVDFVAMNSKGITYFRLLQQ